MTTDSATAGPAATGASPAGAVPGPFPPPSRPAPEPEAPLGPSPAPSRLDGAGRRGRLGGPDGGHPRLPGGRGRPPRLALRSPTSASPSSSETPSPAGPWPRSWAGRTRAPPPRARPPTAPAPRRGCWASSPPASSWPDPAPFAARFRERAGFQSNAQTGDARSTGNLRVRGRAVGRGRSTAPSHPQGAHFAPVSRVTATVHNTASPAKVLEDTTIRSVRQGNPSLWSTGSCRRR